MIFDIAGKSLKSASVLIAVEDLIGDSVGSRLPDVEAELLTKEMARRAVEACPTGALSFEGKDAALLLNYAECIGCGRCIEVATGGFFPASKIRNCGVRKDALIRRWNLDLGAEVIPGEEAMAETAKQIRAIVGRALNIRQVDGGSCNGCEGEIHALTNPYYDLERFNIHFVASPKHADMLLVTGPVTRNMAEAVKRTYEATPAPKLVVAVGACGCSAGIFAGSHAVVGGVDAVIPVDGYIPGCPPTPAMLLSGILRVLR
jgi:Ni,Fe-hydrogenase III small subunit/ferredoxin